MPTTHLKFESGAERTVDYELSFPVLGLDPDGRVVIEIGASTDSPYTFGLTLCCNAFDKGCGDTACCRACYGTKSDDTGSYDPIVADPIAAG